jgi:hypothetical protein
MGEGEETRRTGSFGTKGRRWNEEKKKKKKKKKKRRSEIIMIIIWVAGLA